MNSHTPLGPRLRPRPLPQSQHESDRAQPVRTISSEALFEGGTEVAIHHLGSVYRLKITRQGKLILNK